MFVGQADESSAEDISARLRLGELPLDVATETDACDEVIGWIAAEFLQRRSVLEKLNVVHWNKSAERPEESVTEHHNTSEIRDKIHSKTRDFHCKLNVR